MCVHVLMATKQTNMGSLSCLQSSTYYQKENSNRNESKIGNVYLLRDQTLTETQIS